MKNLAGMLKQASQMQQKMEEIQARLAAMEVEGSAGAGMVRVTLTGKGELRAVRIDPRLATPDDVEVLQDLLLAAHADAKRKSDAASSEEMQQLTAGLPLPPGMKLPF